MNNLMILSTHSGVGKNFISCALLRRLVRNGYSVSPFKGCTIEPYTCILPGEARISFAQTLQCMAAKVEPTPQHCPILATYPFPPGDANSQHCEAIYVEGKPDRQLQDTWPERHRRYINVIRNAIISLESQYDALVIEGGGSPVDFALEGMDLPNQLVFAQAKSPRIILITEMFRGGGYAHLYGTLQLMGKEMRSAVCGVVLNKFTHSDGPSIQAGVNQFEEISGVPVLGCVPYLPRTFIPGEEVDCHINYTGISSLENAFDSLSSTLDRYIDMQRIETLLTG